LLPFFKFKLKDHSAVVLRTLNQSPENLASLIELERSLLLNCAPCVILHISLNRIPPPAHCFPWTRETVQHLAHWIPPPVQLTLGKKQQCLLVSFSSDIPTCSPRGTQV